MASLAQDLLVAVIVAGCAIFSAWRLMSPRLRLRTLDFVAPVATRLGGGAAITRLRNETLGQLAAGCSACAHNKTAVHYPRGRG
jgi:hypothetical protein